MNTEVTGIVTNAETQRARSCAEKRQTRDSTPRQRDAKPRRGIASGLASLLLCAFALNPFCLGAATNDLSGLLQKGLFEEDANRNLDAAVHAYQSLVTAFDQDRKLAATAVFRLGECYRKLGKTNEAILQYDRIVREFGDEATLATLSRQNLAGLGKASSTASTGQAFRDRLQAVVPGMRADIAEEARQLAAKLDGLEQLKNNPEKLANAVQALFPDDLLSGMLVNLPKLREQVAMLKAAPSGANRQGFRVALTGERELLLNNQPIDLAAAETEVKKQLLHIARRTEHILSIQAARLDGLWALAAVQISPILTQAARLEQRRLLEEEIKIAEQDVAAMKLWVENGRAPRFDLSSKERELLALRRQLIALSDAAGPASADGATVGQEVAGSTALGVWRKALGDAEREEQTLAAQIKQIESLGGEERRQVVQQLAPNPVLDSLLKQKTEADLGLVALRQDRNDDHPEVRTKRSQLDLICQRIDDQVEGAIKTMKMKRDALDGTIQTLKAHLAESSPAGIGRDTRVAGRVYVSGKVQQQGAIDFLPGETLTVAKAILRAGGFADLADKKKVKVVRPAEGGSSKQEFQLDLADILEQGKTENDIVLQPGDWILVPGRHVNW